MKWFMLASEQGRPAALFMLAIGYADGRGVPKDEVEAYAYANHSSVVVEKGREFVAELEKTMPADARLRAQQRTKELLKEIEAKIAAKKAGK
jgi:hypothetical protein